MPSANIYFPYESAEEVQSFMADLAEIAKERGYMTVHASQNRGNIRELLEAIVHGELRLVLLTDEERQVAVGYLQRHAEELAHGDGLDWIASEAYKNIAAALVQASEHR